MKQRGETPRGILAWGGKVAFNLHESSDIHFSSLYTSGYYPEWDVELKDPAPMGFGEWSNTRSDDREVRTKTAFLLSAETGVKLTGSWIRYFGIYADYGLNNGLQTTGDHPGVGYVTEHPSGFSYRSITKAVNGSGKPYAEKLVPLSLGLQVRIVPSFRKNSDKEQEGK